MFDTLALFRTSAAMARHAGQRQAVVARNLANADTPGFRPDVTHGFAELHRGGGMRATRPDHLTGGHLASRRPGDAPVRAEPAPNGNGVSLEIEMIEAAEIEREQGRALAIYRHSLTVLRAVVSGR